MSTLLHPTDFSGNSEQAFQIACSIARDRNATLIVLHVVSPRECAPHDLCGNALNTTSDLYRCVWNHFDQLQSLAGTARVSFEIRIGETLDAIMDVVAHEHCELIVLAGRNQVGSFYQQHGCISESLIRRAPCSVLTLRHCYADKFQAPAADVNQSAAQESHADSRDNDSTAVGVRW